GRAGEGRRKHVTIFHTGDRAGKCRVWITVYTAGTGCRCGKRRWSYGEISAGSDRVIGGQEGWSGNNCSQNRIRSHRARGNSSRREGGGCLVAGFQPGHGAGECRVRIAIEPAC